MPTYDYECDACGHKFELFQSITDAPQKKCPACRKQKLRRLFGTGAAIMFKGSGFYQTDYRSDSYKKAEAKEKSSSDSGGEKSGTDSTKSADKKAADTKPSDKKSSDKKAAERKAKGG